MGTSYYELEKPVTHLHSKKTGGHYLIDIWLNYVHSGTLTVGKEELGGVLCLFKSEKAVYHSFYGGTEKGKVTKKLAETDNLILISEYNKIVEKEKLDGEVIKDEE